MVGIKQEKPKSLSGIKSDKILDDLGLNANIRRHDESDRWTTMATIEHNLEQTDKNLDKNLDARAEYKIRLERILEKRKSEYTHKDVFFDEEFCAEHPEIKVECEKIFEEYKDVFQNITGKIDSKYAIRGTIDGEFSATRLPNVSKSPEVRKAIIDKLDMEASDGVLIFPEDRGITPANIIPLMAVQKKDDTGNIIPINDGRMRLIGDCRMWVNKKTKFPALEIDSLADTLRNAAAASVHKYKMKFDISSAFHQIPIHESLYKYFCVYHPEQGVMCYTRLCQGWCGSFGWTRNMFLQLFSKISFILYRNFQLPGIFARLHSII